MRFFSIAAIFISSALLAKEPRSWLPLPDPMNARFHNGYMAVLTLHNGVFGAGYISRVDKKYHQVVESKTLAMAHRFSEGRAVVESTDDSGNVHRYLIDENLEVLKEIDSSIFIRFTTNLVNPDFLLHPDHNLEKTAPASTGSADYSYFKDGYLYGVAYDEISVPNGAGGTEVRRGWIKYVKIDREGNVTPGNPGEIIGPPRLDNDGIEAFTIKSSIGYRNKLSGEVLIETGKYRSGTFFNEGVAVAEIISNECKSHPVNSQHIINQKGEVLAWLPPGISVDPLATEFFPYMTSFMARNPSSDEGAKIESVLHSAGPNFAYSAEEFYPMYRSGLIMRSSCEYCPPGSYNKFPCQFEGYMNTKGELVIPKKDTWRVARPFSEGFAGFLEYPAKGEKSGKFGFIDTSGKEVIPAIYKSAAPFSEGYALVYGRISRKGKERFHLIDTQGKKFSLEL